MFLLPTSRCPARCPGLGHYLGRDTGWPRSGVCAPLAGAGGVLGGAWLSSTPESPAVSLHPPEGIHQPQGGRATGPSRCRQGKALRAELGAYGRARGLRRAGYGAGLWFWVRGSGPCRGASPGPPRSLSQAQLGELFRMASLMALMSRVNTNASNFASHSQIFFKKSIQWP